MKILFTFLFLLLSVIGYTQTTQSLYFYAIENLDTGEVVRRGTTGRDGIPSGSLILAPNTNYREWLFEAGAGLVGFTQFTTPAAGRPFTIPPINLELSQSPDSDGDGLDDDAEFIIGTLPTVADTDEDGINDGAEIAQGLDPNDDNLVRTGIIGTADTRGVAVDVCAFNDIVIIADSDTGISVFNVFNAMNPIIIAQVDTPGQATAVSCSGNLIAVADGNAGMAIIDMSDPPAAEIIWQISTNQVGGTIQAVATAGDLAFVGTVNGIVAIVDMRRGIVLTSIMVGGRVEDLATAGQHLYAYANGQLMVINYLTGPLEVIGSIPSPGTINSGHGRGGIFVGGGVAYLVHRGGYNTFDVNDPTSPQLTAPSTSTAIGWKNFVVNGSGRGIAALGPTFSLSPTQDHVSIFDTKKK